MLFSRIMKLALVQITGHIGQVIRIAMPPLILYYGGIILAARLFDAAGPDIDLALPVATALLITLTAMTLFGVNLSRALITGEQFDWLPRIHAAEFLRYGVASLGFLVFAYLVAWLLGFVSLTIMQALLGQSLREIAFYLGPILTMLSVTILAMFLLRLGATLPALAVNRSFQSALGATSAWKDFLIIAFITQVILTALTWGLTGMSSLIIQMTGNPEGAALVWLYILSVIVPEIIKLVGTLYMFSLTIAAYRILVPQTDEAHS